MNKIIIPPPHRRGITTQWTRMSDKTPEHGDACLIIADSDPSSWSFDKLGSATGIAEYNAIDQKFDLCNYGSAGVSLPESQVFAWAKFNLRAVDSFMHICKEDAKRPVPPVLKSNLDDVESLNIEDL